MDENEKRIEDTLKRIGIDYVANTKKSIVTMIGEEPQASVLDELVRRNLPAFEKAKNEPQGYRYGILKRLLQAEYHGLKLKFEAELEAQERMREERRNQPRIDYSRIHCADPKAQEGLDNISELLDDFFEDDDNDPPASSSEVSSLRQMLAEMKQLRSAELDDWDDDEL